MRSRVLVSLRIVCGRGAFDKHGKMRERKADGRAEFDAVNGNTFMVYNGCNATVYGRPQPHL